MKKLAAVPRKSHGSGSHANRQEGRGLLLTAKITQGGKVRGSVGSRIAGAAGGKKTNSTVNLR